MFAAQEKKIMAFFCVQSDKETLQKKCLRYILEFNPQLLLKVSKIIADEWFVSWKKLFWLWFWMVPPAQLVSGQPEDIQLQLCDLGTFAWQTEKPNSILTFSHTPMGLAWTSAHRPLILNGFLESITGKQWCSVLDVVTGCSPLFWLIMEKISFFTELTIWKTGPKCRAVCVWRRMGAGGTEIPATIPELTEEAQETHQCQRSI